uniref:BTB family protein n=1 Tax=Marseillevirus LCMAC102 TaxID=2506603 RepID=A0A481YUU9_9VIRU|nr:MAG: BTB family protein [Marseillevirus LCMAC102]
MNTSTEPLNINVGGKIFTTTKSTLCDKSGFFAALFNYSELKHSGFIDRDPTGFKHILRFLRDSNYLIPDKWLFELEFYQIAIQKKEEDIKILKPQDITYDCHKSIKDWKYASPKYIDRIVEIESISRCDQKSVFKIKQFFGQILYVCYDFVTDPIHTGVIINNSREIFEFGGYIPFPRIRCIPYADIAIIMHGKIDKLHIAVRYYFNPIDKLHGDYVDLEHNLMYNAGTIENIYFPQPPWLC